MTTTGVFIVFEGGEGAGKTTQLQLLAQSLRRADRDPLVTREPGGTPLGEQIRTLLLGGGHIPPAAEALLFTAARVAHVEQVIRPALEAGRVVLCDRYADSTTVYQGYGRDLGSTYLRNLSQWATHHLEPDLVVVLDIDPRVGLARAQQTGGPDRIEQEDLDFHDRVRAGFRHEAEDAVPRRRSKTRYLMLDADRPTEAIAAEVTSAVAELFLQRAVRRAERAEPASEPAGSQEPAGAGR